MTDDTARINSTLWFALEKAGDKSKDQKDRGALLPGDKTPVRLTVEGKVDNVPVATAIVGHLQVAHDGTTSSKVKPPAELCLALALSYVPKTRRQQLLEAGLSEPDPDLLAAAEQFVQSNTMVDTKPRRGSVSFEFGPLD